MARVKIYTTDHCGYCVRARTLLARQGIPYDEEDVTHAPERRAWLVQATGRRTVPQVFLDDRPVGGCDDLYALDASGELERWRSSPPSSS